MADENLTSSEWQSVAEISASMNLSPRTLYNWARSKAVASKVEGGVTLLRVGDVAAKLRTRMRPATAVAAAANGTAAALPAGTSAGGNGNGGNVGKVVALDGETEARVFALLDQGLDPVAIVRQEALPSSVVLEALKQYRALRDQPVAVVPTPADRLERIEPIVARLFKAVEEIEYRLSDMASSDDDLRKTVGRLTESLAAMAARLETAEGRIIALITYR